MVESWIILKYKWNTFYLKPQKMRDKESYPVYLTSLN